jgi:hypothetical protein
LERLCFASACQVHIYTWTYRRGDSRQVQKSERVKRGT